MQISYNQIICEVVQQHKNYIETGNMFISKQDLIDASQESKIKNLTYYQLELCDVLNDIIFNFSN